MSDSSNEKRRAIKGFLVIAFILLGTLLYFLGRNLFMEPPSLQGLSLVYRDRELTGGFTLDAEGGEDWEIEGCLLDPKRIVMLCQKELFTSKTSKNKKMSWLYHFDQEPEAGVWKLKISAKLIRGGLWERDLIVKDVILP
ncbi:MAG: hypothetical protein CVV50_01520 [Spirochaetae bacterium HGW-Spirochaetae-6]|jgi:hypothetical protein|nr:MAG: hypothetical protein CVV50_01520 [Spirochaetae bacterium HGW-Spirochaetae-6]